MCVELFAIVTFTDTRHYDLIVIICGSFALLYVYTFIIDMLALNFYNYKGQGLQHQSGNMSVCGDVMHICYSLCRSYCCAVYVYCLHKH